MSGDELTSIEKNGNYWLSKSNTAYHIINPNATSLTTLESDGYYSLARGGDTFYVLDASGNSIKLDLNGSTFFADYTGSGVTNTYTPSHVEESPFKYDFDNSDTAFLIRAERNDQPSWNNSPWFNHNTWGFFFR